MAPGDIQPDSPTAAGAEKSAAAAETPSAEVAALRDTINAQIDTQLQQFVELVADKGFDFSGWDSNDMEGLKKNPVFIKLYAGLESFFKKNKSNAPEELQKKWMAASSEFLAEKISSYSGIFEAKSMNFQDAQQALDDLENQIGPFEKWIVSSSYAAEYTKWQTEQTEAAETKQKYEGRKGEVQKKLEEEKKRFGATSEYPGLKSRFQTLETSLAEADNEEKLKAVEEQIAGLDAVHQQLQKLIDKANSAAPHFETAQNFLPAALTQELETLRKEVSEFGGVDSAVLEKRIDEFTVKIAPFEALKPLAEDNSIPQETRDQVIESLKAGTKTPEQAKAELESAKSAAEKAALGEEDENVSWLDKTLGWVDGMKSGKLKSTLKFAINKIIPFLVGTAITWPFIGDFIKEHLSPKIRAAYGDTEAQKTLALHKSLKDNGIKLPVSLFDALMGRTAKEVTEAIRGNQIETNDAIKAELAKLASHIETSNGATSEIIFADFLKNHPVKMAQSAPAATPSLTPAPQELFAGLTPDKRAALESAKAKDVAEGKLPDLVKEDERAKKIAAKLKENGAAETTVDPNQTVKSYIEAHLDKNWQVA